MERHLSKLLQGVRDFELELGIIPNKSRPCPHACFLLRENYDKVVTEVLTSLFEEIGWSGHITTHQMIQGNA